MPVNAHAAIKFPDCGAILANAVALQFTIDVQVGRLRRKLGDDPQNPSLIETVRGGGYIFTPPVEMR